MVIVPIKLLWENTQANERNAREFACRTYNLHPESEGDAYEDMFFISEGTGYIMEGAHCSVNETYAILRKCQNLQQWYVRFIASHICPIHDLKTGH